VLIALPKHFSQGKRAQTMVFARAFLTALLCLSIKITLIELFGLLNNEKTLCFSSHELIWQIKSNATNYIFVFGAVYTALYARFSSQWNYLSNVYNQIKAAESRALERSDIKVSKFYDFKYRAKQPAEWAIAEWKAGFIEDAYELHLYTKPLFSSIIKSWLSDVIVREFFDKNTIGSKSKILAIEEGIKISLQKTLQ
jgi:hypothetical protein